MAETGQAVLRAGQLLIATPLLVDPNFERTVVLVLDHDDTGSLGVVLNRPSPVPVGDVLQDWQALVAEPGVLFHGGPVATDSALAVASIPNGQAPESDPVGFRRLFGETGIIDLDTPTELLDHAISRMRIFAGYAGWGVGQLEAEVEEGSWYVVPAEGGDVFGASPDGLWSRVLRRQPGELAWVSTRPADPTLN
ncbi:MAG TPA: YqgE/AlgH family protein [Nocardioidaceae bacterium]|nr:YqgE/AlgH family protein [Nocardioidaceae bacterium]